MLRSKEAAQPKLRAGERTRSAILEAAADIASAEGLEGLTIGKLALELSMSKSGLFAHFGSKEDLQMATVEAAREVFIHEIVDPAFRSEVGMRRLNAMMERWLSYVERSVFRGGCFFAAASAEFDGRPGRVRNLIAQLTRQWLEAIEEQIRISQQNGEIRASVDSHQLAFELHALVQEANWAHQLLGLPHSFARAMTGIRKRLVDASTLSGRKKISVRKTQPKRHRSRSSK